MAGNAYSGYAALTPNYGVSPQEAAGYQGSALGQQSLYDQKLANIQGKFGTQQAKIGAGAQLGSAQAAAEANKFGATQQRGAGQDIINFKNARFGQLFPFFQQLAGGMGGAGGGGRTVTRGDLGPAPPVGGGFATGSFGNEGVVPGLGELAPAISADQLQQNINVNNAQNWAQAGGATRRGVNQLAGGGLGANSPLAMALRAQQFGGALQANTAGATGARNDAAKLNADQALGAYQAKAGALASEYGSRRTSQASQYGAYLGAKASEYGSNLDYQAALAQVAAQKQNALLSALASFSS